MYLLEKVNEYYNTSSKHDLYIRIPFTYDDVENDAEFVYYEYFKVKKMQHC